MARNKLHRALVLSPKNIQRLVKMIEESQQQEESQHAIIQGGDESDCEDTASS